MTWDVAGRTAVVTGANSGIGREMAAGLAEAGAGVVITARDLEKGRAAAAELEARTGRAVEVMRLDLADLASVREFARQFLDGHDALHVLVNNAGGTWSPRKVTADGHETTFQVNHLAPFLLTNLLLDRMKESAPARIVTTSSGAHRGSKGLDFDDLDRDRRRYSGMRAYNDSKLCNILFTRELARRLEGTGVTATCFHPGFVRTNFSGGGDTRLMAVGFRIGSVFARTPRKGADTGLHLATSPEVEGVSGEYFFDRRPGRLSRHARDDEAARRLWEATEAILGLAGARP